MGLTLLATFLALLFGAASAVLPAWFVLSMLIVPAVAVVSFVRPEYALTACIALVCNLVHPALVPRMPVFGGTLAAADAVLAMLAVYSVWALAAQSGRVKALPVQGGRLLAYSLGLFGIWLVVAVISSLAFRGLNPSFVFGETRDLLYLAILPIALVVLRQPERQQRFVVSLVVVGCLFSVGQILQGVFKIPVFGASGMSYLETLGYREYSTTRSNTHGLNVIIFSLLLTVGAYVLNAIRKPLFYAVAGLLFIGIVLTFGRTTFASVLLCGILVVWWLNPRKLPQLASVLLLTVAVGSVAAYSWKPESFAAVYYRMTSIGAEIDYGYSAQWRFWEVDAMLPHIQANPLAGIGLGADYKGASGSSERPELNRYVHNGYLYMAGKMGLPALGFFLLLMASIFAIGRRLAVHGVLPWNRIVGASCAAMMIRFLFASITEPHFMSDYGVSNIAIAGALAVVAARRSGAADVPGTAAKAFVRARPSQRA